MIGKVDFDGVPGRNLMDKRDLEELDLGIELAINNQEEAAHFIFARLSESNPDNSSLLALCAYTAPDSEKAQAAIETAMRIDPANPLLPKSRVWLEENRLNKPPTPATSDGPVIAPARARAILPAEKVAKPPAKTLAKATIPLFSAVWWLRLACSLLFFGAAAGLLYILVTANNLNATEKAYFDRVGQLNLKTRDVNTQLQTAVEQFNAGKLEKPELVNQLRQVVGLDDEFKSLKSPSPRFDKLDGLLGEAFSYYDDGATNLINGLKAGDNSLLTEGNRLIGMGNDYLHQARDELKALGG